MKPFKLIFLYAHNYVTELTITALSMLALVGVQLLIPWIIRTLVSAITDPSSTLDVMSLVTKLTVVALAVYIARAGLQFLRSYLAHVAGWGVVADVRKFIYEHMQRLSLRYYEDKQVGQLMSNVVNDTDLFEQLIAHALPDVIVNIITFVAVTIVLVSLNWKLTLLSTIPIPLVILSLRVYAKYVRPAFRRRQQELGDLNATLNDNLSGNSRNKGIHTRARRGTTYPQAYRQLSFIPAQRAQADGDLSAVCGIHIFAGDADRHFLWRATRFARSSARGRPGRFFPLP